MFNILHYPNNDLKDLKLNDVKYVMIYQCYSRYMDTNKFKSIYFNSINNIMISNNFEILKDDIGAMLIYFSDLYFSIIYVKKEIENNV